MQRGVGGGLGVQGNCHFYLQLLTQLSNDPKTWQEIKIKCKNKPCPTRKPVQSMSNLTLPRILWMSACGEGFGGNIILIASSTCMSSVFVSDSAAVVHKNPIFVIKKIKAAQQQQQQKKQPSGVCRGWLWTQLKTSPISLEHTHTHAHTCARTVRQFAFSPTRHSSENT